MLQNACLLDNLHKGIAGNQGAGAFGASCDGSPKASNSSPLVSPTTTIKMPRGMYNVDVTATFGVLLTIVGNLDVFSRLKTNADVIPFKVLHVDDSTIVDALVAENLNVDESIIFRSISIQDKPSSYFTAAGGSRPKPREAGGLKLDPGISNVNFRSLSLKNLCEGVNVSIPRKFVETVSTRFADIFMVISLNSDELQRFFFFQFKTLKGLEFVLKNGPWMICSSPIILKKWSMSTRLCKEELTRILVWVKIHDVPIKVFSEDGLSIIASQIVSIPITVVTPNVPTPTVEMTNDGFQTVGKKKKNGKSKSTNSGQLVNQPPKATITSTKESKITMSNSYATLENESDEDVENLYNESANLIHSKTGHRVLKTEFPKGKKWLAISLFQGYNKHRGPGTEENSAVLCLWKSPCSLEGIEVDDNDSFMFNDVFTAPLYCIKGGEESKVSWTDEVAQSRVEEEVCWLCLFEINPREENRVREKVNSRYMVENVLMGCGGAYVGMKGTKADRILRELSGEEAWEAIENFAQGKKDWDNPPNTISEQELGNLKAQAKRLFGNDS
nr:hypothetical protein [Tanacetum cinerariifolium]